MYLVVRVTDSAYYGRCRSLRPGDNSRVAGAGVPSKGNADAQHPFACALVFKVSGTGAQQIIQGNHACELVSIGGEHGEPGKTGLRHAVHDDTQRLVSIGHDWIA